MCLGCGDHGEACALSAKETLRQPEVTHTADLLDEVAPTVDFPRAIQRKLMSLRESMVAWSFTMRMGSSPRLGPAPLATFSHILLLSCE